MQDILTTINHTTVEALGFKNLRNIGSGDDVFKRGNVNVFINKNGIFTVSVDDRATDITDLIKLKRLINV